MTNVHLFYVTPVSFKELRFQLTALSPLILTQLQHQKNKSNRPFYCIQVEKCVCFKQQNMELKSSFFSPVICTQVQLQTVPPKSHVDLNCERSNAVARSRAVRWAMLCMAAIKRCFTSWL